MKPRRVQTAFDYRQRICLVMDFISTHLEDDPTLDTMAKVAHFSPYHFHRVFHAVTGETVFGFIRRLRLEKAATQLLERPGADITGIALDGGFSSSQNFAKAFRAQFGMTPTAWRRRKHGNKPGKGEVAVSLRMGQDARQLERFPTGTAKEMNMTKKSDLMIRADVKEMPAWHVAYARRVAPYGKEASEGALGELCAWASPKGLIGQTPIICRYWDDPHVTAPENCRTDACLVVPDGTPVEPPIALADIPGGRHLVCECKIPVSRFSEAWDAAYQTLVERGLECADRPCYELYHSDDSSGFFLVDVCIPLK